MSTLHHSRTSSKAFFHDLLRYVPSRLLPAAFGLIILPVFTRLFDPEEYGIYTIVITTAAVLTIIATEWIGPSAIRFYAQFEKNGSVGTYAATVLYLSVLSIGMIASVGAIGILLLHSHLSFGSTYLLIGLGLFVVSAIASVMLQVLVARRMASAYSFYTVWQQCICLALGLLAAWLFLAGIKAVLLVTIVGTAVSLPLLFYSTFRGIGKGTFSHSAGLQMMLYGFPLMVTNLASWALHLSDRYVIQAIRGSQEVGLYAVSYSIADRSISLVLSLLALASGPIAMQVWEKEGAYQAKLFVHKLTKYFLIIASPATVDLSCRRASPPRARVIRIPI